MTKRQSFGDYNGGSTTGWLRTPKRKRPEETLLEADARRAAWAAENAKTPPVLIKRAATVKAARVKANQSPPRPDPDPAPLSRRQRRALAMRPWLT